MIIGSFDDVSIFVDEPYDEEDYYNEFNKEEILKYTSLDFPLKIKNLSTQKIYSEPNEKRFIFKIKNKIIGACDLYSIEKNHKAKIRFWIGTDFQGKGIASRAAKLILEYAFKELKLVRIEARALTENIGSWKTLEKIGFEREGTVRKANKKGDEYIDDYIYSVVR